ncbi:Aldo/keto reductase [Penicillium italicum]|uniref:Aldo/keto reductase n=1 Tax=Penicillium italicum TaxID=40296 RepID=A0A0A2KY59_PENIT|nr:Aldo/keto reductase [Penicillium italicum]
MVSNAQRTFKHSNGAQIPAIGLGTWQDEAAQEAAVLYAVGKAIKQSGIPRSETFVTTKLWNHKHHPDDVGQALQLSLDDLGLVYINLFLMHWPVAFKRGDDLFPSDKDGNLITENIDYLDTYKAMEGVFKSGKAKAIGVLNLSRQEIERIIEKATIKPAVHQMELHPWLQQQAFFENFHRTHGIHVTQYSPFGNSNEIYGSREQHERITQNFDIAFELEPSDIEKINSIDKKSRFNDSSKDFCYELFTDLDGKQK